MYTETFKFPLSIHADLSGLLLCTVCRIIFALSSVYQKDYGLQFHYYTVVIQFMTGVMS